MDKEAALADVLAQAGVDAERAVYVGDDTSDVGALRAVGLGVAVADAVDDAIEAAGWVTERPGGHGAVREVCDAIFAQLAERE